MRSIRFAIALAAAAVMLNAATPVPPFDYFVFLYQPPGIAQVTVTMGNNAFDGAAAAGPTYNAYMKVTDAAGSQVCMASDVQAAPIPTGKAWEAYRFKITYPPPNFGGLERNKGTTKYTVEAAISPEYYSSDKNLSNEFATQTFTFPAGGTPSCINLPRPEFH